MNRVAIVGGARTPIGKAGRAYQDVHPVDLLATSLRGLVANTGVEPTRVERVLTGCVHQAGDQAYNVGRNGWLAAGFSELTPALTLDAQCCSSLEAASLGYGLVASGQADVVVAAGVEALSRVAAGSTYGPGIGDPYPPSLLGKWSMPHQSEAVERMAVKYSVTREQADAFGVESHLRAARGWDENAFEGEIVTVDTPSGAPLLERDEGIRPDSSIERAAKLRPAYAEGGLVTAANASQLSDGAASLLLASERACEEQGLEPLAWVQATASVGADVDLMFEGPLHSTSKVLDLAGRTIDEIDIFEVHEAYAVPVVVWMREFGVSHEIVNLHGGAISMGHPFGASGVRQLIHLAKLLHSGRGTVGLQTMCGGGGLGSAMILTAA